MSIVYKTLSPPENVLSWDKALIKIQLKDYHFKTCAFIPFAINRTA